MSGNDQKLKIGAWDLHLTDQEVSEKSVLLKDKDGGDPGESTFEPDLRKEVPAEDYRPGGKFRCEYMLWFHYSQLLVCTVPRN